MNILILTFILLFSNCENNNNEDLTSKNGYDLFVGKWELMSLTGGFAPSETFNENEIIWEFNSNDSLKITIENDISDKSRLPIKIDTILPYSYDTLNISIGDYEYEYILKEKSLKLIDNLASDGIMLEFKMK